MGRKQDKLWIHTERVGKKYKCNFCGKKFPATTSVVRFRYHLAGIPGQGVQLCDNVPEPIKQEAMEDVPETLKEEAMHKGRSHHHKKPKTGSTSPYSDSTLSETGDANCSNEVHNLLAKFFEINEIDCSIVESTSFLNLVHALCKYSPGNYVPPCSATLRSELIPLFRQEVEQSVATAKQSLKITGFTVVPHVWCSQKEGQSFLSIIACSKKSVVLLNTFELQREKTLLEKFFSSVILDVGAENIVQCIVDDNVWAGLFGEFLTERYPHVCVTKCAALHMQSLFDTICMEVKWVQAIFNAAQVIFDYACHNSDISALMRKHSGGKSVKPCQGYDMLGAIFEAKEELVKLVQSSEWLAHGNGKEENGCRVAKIIKNDKFWDQGKKLQMALKPLFQALHLDDIGELGFDDLYRLMKMAEEENGKLFNNSVSGCINGVHKAATFVNPKYMSIKTTEDRREMDEGIEYILMKLVAVEDRAAFVDQTLHYREMLANPSKFFKTLAIERLSPCEWWNSFGYEFPVLGKYAIKILSQPCSILSLKSNLSAFLANQNQQMTGMVPGMKDLSLRVNAFLMEKSNTSEASKRDKVEVFGEHKLKERSHKPVYNFKELSFSPMTRSIELSVPQHLKLHFMTMIPSPLFVGQKVEGEQGSQIHIFLGDPTADRVMQIALPSMLKLTVSVLDGDFIDEASSSDNCWTGEHFDSNDLRLTRKEPLVTGDLEVILEGGKGVLGQLSFNYSSLWTTRSGQFRLGVKTALGYWDGVRILEGISSAFVVLDNDDVRRPPLAACDMPLPDEFPSLSFEGLNGLIEHGQHEVAYSNGDMGYVDVGSIWNYMFQRCINPKHAAARRVKKKALLHFHKWNKRKSLVQTAKQNKDNDHKVMESTSTVDLTCRIDDNQMEEDMISKDDALRECDSANAGVSSADTLIPLPLPLPILFSGDGAKSMEEMQEVHSHDKVVEACDDTEQGSSLPTRHNTDVDLFGVQLSEMIDLPDSLMTLQHQPVNFCTRTFGDDPANALSIMLNPVEASELVNGGEQISSLSNSGFKIRMSPPTKVALIPVSATTNNRPTGEQSDLWKWRKYGQKPIKGSPYPRGYYRCISSKGCSARKQVERCQTDPNMLVITYTYEHNHPCPTQRNTLAVSTRSQRSSNAANSKTPQNNLTGFKEQNEIDGLSPTTVNAGASLTTSASVKEEVDDAEVDPEEWGLSISRKRKKGTISDRNLMISEITDCSSGSHGASRRCAFLGCTNGAEGKTDFCIDHGGGKWCGLMGCAKTASGVASSNAANSKTPQNNLTGFKEQNETDGLSPTTVNAGASLTTSAYVIEEVDDAEVDPEEWGLSISRKRKKGTISDRNLMISEITDCSSGSHGASRRCEFLGCTNGAEGKTDFCIDHGGGKWCGLMGCTKTDRGMPEYCIGHGGGRRCLFPGCTKREEEKTGYCKTHGLDMEFVIGGYITTTRYKCQYLGGCIKRTEGKTEFCINHAGGRGKHCRHEGCTMLARGCSDLCRQHGGGKRCQLEGCTKLARGCSDLCGRHGGGKRCQFKGCNKRAVGITDFCKPHESGASGECVTHCEDAESESVTARHRLETKEINYIDLLNRTTT